jgi:hypothetical protein
MAKQKNSVILRKSASKMERNSLYEQNLASKYTRDRIQKYSKILKKFRKK